MNKSIAERIGMLRVALDSDPSSMVAGDIRPGDESVTLAHQFKVVEESLHCFNGGRMGVIDLWSAEELSNNQYYLEMLELSNERYLVIGQLLYDPLIIDSETGVIFIMQEESLLELENVKSFDDFLSLVLSEEYGKLVPDPDSDSWVQFLDNLRTGSQ